MTYTATAAAQLAGVTRATVYTWCRMGAVKAAKVVGRWVIEAASLIKRISMGARTPTSEKKATMTQPTDITITTEGNTLYLAAPYKPAANADYKGLGARWDAARKNWKFAAKDLDALREVLRDHFGYDDRPVETVDVRVALSGEYSRGATELNMFNRTLASRAYRDADVKLGRGVRLVEGEFDGSAGSTKYPSLGDVDGIVLEVRGVPANHADLDDADVTILETTEVPDPELASLEAEKAALLARLAEIDALLAQK